MRRQLQVDGVVSGAAGDLNAGLYSPTNVAVVYDEVLRQAQAWLSCGYSVILDGTWRDAGHRDRARELSRQASVPIVEFTCSVPIGEASARIRRRPRSNSDATPDIAAALTGTRCDRLEAHDIDTSRPLVDSVKEAQQICCLAT